MSLFATIVCILLAFCVGFYLGARGAAWLVDRALEQAGIDKHKVVEAMKKVRL